MKKLVFLVVMALLVSAVHAVTMPWAACASRHAPQASTASRPHGCDEAPSSGPSQASTPHSTAMGHLCCTGLCPHTEPFVLPVLAAHYALAPSPVLGVDLGLASAIFKPPKSRV